MITVIAAPQIMPGLAGQVRLFMLDGKQLRAKYAIEHYQAQPQQWAEVGLATNDGKLRCLEENIPAQIRNQIIEAGKTGDIRQCRVWQCDGGVHAG